MNNLTGEAEFRKNEKWIRAYNAIFEKLKLVQFCAVCYLYMLNEEALF
jgi:hypothetical protein